jgi:hypothetical protein
MNKTIFSVIAGIILIGTVIGYSEANISAPFDYDSSGVVISNFDLDFKAIEIILDVETIDLPATIEIAFERDFFDAKKMNQDIEFTIIADGEMVYYEEIIANSDIRRIKFNLTSETEIVEIFGTHLKGITNQNAIIEVSEENLSEQKVEDLEKISELELENQKLVEENKLLKEENLELDGRIFELENLVSALEVQVHNLNSIVTEQVKVIYNWVLGYSL